MPTYRKAEIIEIIPSYRYMDGLIERRAAEVVKVRDETGEIHDFVTGSINTVDCDYRKVGQKGIVHWISTKSYHMWFFNPEKAK